MRQRTSPCVAGAGHRAGRPFTGKLGHFYTLAATLRARLKARLNGLAQRGCADFTLTRTPALAPFRHGRLCMLAFAGFIANDAGWGLPGLDIKCSSVEAHDKM